MAQSKSASQGTKRSGSQSKSASGSRKSPGRKSTPAKAAPRPIRREVGGTVCLLVGLLSCIGYFTVDAWFIRFFCGFIKGLVGWGFYIFPPALILAGITLLFHRGRPVALRVTFALLLPLLLGAFAHLIFADAVYQELGDGLVRGLYETGMELQSGGFLAGLLAVLLRSAVSIYGALPLLALLFALFALLAVNLTPRKIWDHFHNRPPRPAYEPLDPEPEPEPEHRGRKRAPPAQGGVLHGGRPGAGARPSAQIRRTAPGHRHPAGRRGDGRAQRPGRFLQRLAPGSHAGPVSGHPGCGPQRTGGSRGHGARRAGPQALAAHSQGYRAQARGPFHRYPAGRQGGGGGGASLAGGGRQHCRRPRRSGKGDLRSSKAADKPSREEVEKETADIARSIQDAMDADVETYRYPSLDLLQTGGPGTVDGREEIALNRERLETTIHSFGVHANITDVTRGPTVTRYDLELEAGVKLNKLTNLAGDLALSLGVASVRIAPIPDKISTVGVEVPNKLVSTVYLRDIIASDAFQRASSKLSFAIGKDIGGNAIVGNIAKLPHMLIAGTTGSGKSVCMNSLILSLLYKATPEEVRLIMIDPKMVELGIYNGIPHLFIPVVTDPKKAAGALQWAVVEMLKRYRLFSEIGVRDLAGYNKHQRGVEGGQTLPQVVIVIDELADLMLVASKEVEESICRVAQMGRASGMHLIIATQRPSADVITGLMKANIPSRIAFAVSSALESRIILDTQGAEKLIGQGDMLYAPLGSGKPLRVQGAFVSDEERERVINFIKSGSQAQYSDEILAQIEKAAEGKASGAHQSAEPEEEDGFAQYDELLPQAVEVIFETKQASVSMLQRRLKLGYSRAARLVDQMEELGVVGPFEGSKPRQIMITREQWQEMQLIRGTAPLEAPPEEVPVQEDDMVFQEMDTEDMDNADI